MPYEILLLRPVAFDVPLFLAFASEASCCMIPTLLPPLVEALHAAPIGLQLSITRWKNLYVPG